jgi:uncharacterized protein
MDPVTRPILEFTNDTLDIAALPRFETVSLTPLERRYWKVLLLSVFTSFAIIGGMIVAGWFFIDEVPGVIGEILVAYAISLALTLFFCRLSFLKKAYAFREHDVILRHGIIATSTIVIPYNRIQHVALHEGVYSRMFRLAGVKVYTAGGNSGDIDIPGIRKETAEDIKQLLMGKIQKAL